MSGASTAWRLAICVVLVVVALGMALTGILVRGLRTRTFLVAGAVGISAVVGLDVYNLVSSLNKKSNLRRDRKQVEPSACPDYWRNEYSKCGGLVCVPEFDDEALGKVHLSPTHSRHTQHPVGTLAAGNGAGTCQSREDRGFPWVEVDVACDSAALRV